MGHYDDQRDRWEEEDKRRSSRRVSHRLAGRDPDELERKHKEYLRSKSALKSMEYHRKIVEEYERGTGPKW